MKSFHTFINTLIFSALLLLILTCSKENNLLTPQVAGNIIGKIRNSDGAPVRGVYIRLVPADFDPRTAAAAVKIDSTETDQNGMYSFSLASSGFFNISAYGFGKYCFEDSVYGSERDQFRIQDDTLKAPGAISGIARLRPGADSKQIIILVLGTNTYVTPSDSSGAFLISPLAQGRYKLRFLTLDKDYDIFDTMVSVESGKTTSLPGVHLPFRGLPAIGPVAAQYDPHSMFVTLSWPACDTSNIDCFYIFRNTGIEQAPYRIVGKTDTSFSEDLSMLYASMHDTLRYSIAAMGKDMAIGRVSVAPGFIPASIVKRIDAVSLSGLAMNLYGNFGDFTVDGNHNIYLCGDGWIAKIDSLGHAGLGYCDGYSPPDSNSWEASASSIQTDGGGNVYYYSPRDSLLVKFSADLKPVAKQTLLCGNMEVNAQGSVYTFFNVAKFTGKPDAFSIKIFDSTLFMVDSIPMLSSVTDENFWPQQMLGDTVVFLRSDASMKAFKTSDILFNQIQTVAIGEKIDHRYLPEPIVISQVAYGSNGESVIGFWKGGSLPECGQILCILDASNKLIGRFFLSDKDLFGRYVFDGIDRIYLCNFGSQSIEILTLNRTM